MNDLVAQLDAEGLGPDTLAQLAMLKDGARQLSYELSNPSAQFVSGVGQVADGARQLSDGLALLDDGGKALADGTGQLVDGTGPITGVVAGAFDERVRRIESAAVGADEGVRGGHCRAGRPGRRPNPGVDLRRRCADAATRRGSGRAGVVRAGSPSDVAERGGVGDRPARDRGARPTRAP